VTSRNAAGVLRNRKPVVPAGKLSLIEARSARFNFLGQAQILKGRESWTPMALADDRLIARDLTRLACLDLSAKLGPGV